MKCRNVDNKVQSPKKPAQQNLSTENIEMKSNSLLEVDSQDKQNTNESVQYTKKCLPYLIAKCKWNQVYQKLVLSPDEASIPIPTGSGVVVYALHQAICNNVNPVPEKVLLLLIKAFPIALDHNAFIGACENSQLSRGLMEVLLNQSNTKVYETVKGNAVHYVCKAVQRKNVGIVELFIERFPSILESDILSFACRHGTADIVDKILAAGIRHNVKKGSGLFSSIHTKEDALGVAIGLYDETDIERRNILVTCIQYANAIKMGKKILDPNYSVILAAVGMVPKHIFGSLLQLYSHEFTNTNGSGRHAILKAIKMSESTDTFFNEIPSIFESAILIEACSNGNSELVQQFLEESTHNHPKTIFKEHRNTAVLDVSKKNALEVALDLFDENNHDRCRILRTCIQHANAVMIGKKSPSPNYPTVLAAAGVVPMKYLVLIGKVYKHELSKLDHTGKLALKKVFKMAEERTKYACRLDVHGQYPLTINTSRRKRRISLESIPSSTELIKFIE